jgi:hypothetical protein
MRPVLPLPISFPNTLNAPPGAAVDLYFFDLSIGTWNIWGMGTVSQDGTQVVSDPGFGLAEIGVALLVVPAITLRRKSDADPVLWYVLDRRKNQIGCPSLTPHG